MAPRPNTIDPAHPNFRMEEWPLYWVMRVGRQYSMDLDRSLKRIGMDVARWRVLIILSEHQQASVTMLSDHAVIKLPTMTKTIARMEAQGLVRTFPNPDDRRVTLVEVTELGREKTALVRQQASRIFQSAFRDISGEEAKVLVATLMKVFGNLVNLPE
jgi:DNA-binding MarR family transcriptional regulator